MSTKVLLLTSMCLNIGLGFAYWLMTRPVELPAIEPSRPLVVSTVSAKPSVASAILTNVIPQEFQWSQLETIDYKEYIKRLRALNCPESTIQDIILADLDNVYEPKLNKLRGIDPVATVAPYWQLVRPVPKAKLSVEVEEEIKAMQEERAALVKELLGVSEWSIRAGLEWFEEATDVRHSFLNPEQREKLAVLEKELEEMRRDGRRVTWTMEDAWRMQAVVKMREFMSAEEITEYQMRASREAGTLRTISGVIDLNESEFRELFKLAMKDKEEARQISAAERSTPEYQKKREEKEEELRSGLVSLLGEERLKDIQRANEDSFKDLIVAAPFLGYDRAAAREVDRMQNDVLEAMRAINGNPALSPEAKGKALQEIRQATEKRVSELIGTKGLIYYRQRGGGWIREISPPRTVSAQ